MKKIRKLLLILISLLFFQLFLFPVSAQEHILLEYYYNESCDSCIELMPILDEVGDKYNDTVIIVKKEITRNDVYFEEFLSIIENSNLLTSYPFAVISNMSTNELILEVNEFQMTVKYIGESIDKYLAKEKINKSEDSDIIYTPFGKINVSGLSLPILAIILGGIDSFNPCAFFILIFLLNLLIYARSRRRMLLIGGIFIFFSGFLYMVFMFILYNTLIQLQTKENIIFLSILVGLIVLPMGILNIKDFFFFKKGASLSIPDDKKPKIYKQMRGLIKNPKLGATIIGTIILAATVNFYELICTIGLPLVFIKELVKNSIEQSSASYFSYILLYNIVYVIPLVIITFIFVFTLGKRKLSEWHGRIMKLVSGIMLTSFGLIFLVNYQLLEKENKQNEISNAVWNSLIIGMIIITIITTIIAILIKKKK